MTKTIKITSWVTAGLVAAGSVATGTYFIVKFILSKQFNRIDLGPKGEIQADITNPNKRFNITWFANDNGTQFMTHDEYEQLNSYLSTHLYYGPESNSLQEIVFGDRNVIHEGTSGLYFPSTGQIFINTTYYQNAIDIPFGVRRDSVFEVIAHEYGHHFASCYFKDYKASDNSNIPTNETYTDGFSITWNKSLLDSFTNLFNLTGTISTVKSVINQPMSILNSNYNNISFTASVNDLYEYANHNAPFPLIKGTNYYFGIDNTASSPVPYLTAGKDDNLKYIYSADEQIARKFEQSFFPKNFLVLENSIKDGISFMPRKYITKNVPNIWSPFAFDLAHTKQLNDINTADWSKNKLIYPDTIFGGTMSDSTTPTSGTIISNSSLNLYSFILKVMGYRTQLAQVFTQNTQKVIGTDNNGYTYLTKKNSNEMNNIKFSGYTDKSYGYMAVVNPKTQTVVANFQLITGTYENSKDDIPNPLFHFFGKRKELTQYGTENDLYTKKHFYKPSTPYYSYIMKDFVNYNTFRDQNDSSNHYSIYFNNDPTLKIGSFFIADKSKNEQVTSIYNGGGKAQLTNYKEEQDFDYQYARFTFDDQERIVVQNNY